jgi:protein lifeguard
MKNMYSDEVDDRVKFVRKVYSILACQLTLTAAFIVLVQTSESTRYFATTNFGLAIGCCVMSIVLMCAIICCFGRTAPINYVLLMLFTMCETYMVGGLTAHYRNDVVILAGLVTALVTIALTVYAMRTNVPIEVFGAMSWVVCLAMIPIAIIGWCMDMPGLHTVYCCMGVLLYSLYLIIDTMMICGGKSMSGSNVQCSMDDYIIGALMLYLDIIMLFIYILRILGDKK